jgi:hypothetical protein
MTSRRADRWTAALVFVVVAGLVGITANDLGFTRDEGYYFKAGSLYAQWWRLLVSDPATALSAGGIDRHLSYNFEHPFLLKGLFGLSLALQSALGLPWPDHVALRLPAFGIAGLAAAFVWLLARELLPRSAALVAVLLFVSMPHVFWHMHVACFDIGVVAAHAAVVWAWLRFRHTAGGGVIVGVTFGVAAAVKHNVLPVPGLLFLHWLVCEGPRTWENRKKDGVWRLPFVFFSLAFIGPITYLLLWPYLWPDVAGRFLRYISFHLHHENYPILYFGDLLTEPPFPWLFPFVMSAVTIPLPVLALMVTGVLWALVCIGSEVQAHFRAHRRPQDSDRAPPREHPRIALGDVRVASSAETAALLVLNGFFPFLLIALPSTPIFGGTKHWMNGLPFLCVLGAWALAESIARMTRARESQAPRRAFVQAAIVVGLGVVAALPGATISARVWPYGLCSYNELVGFSRGAANLGMQRTFWGYEVREALPVLNERTPRQGKAHWGDVNADSYARYVGDGLLRRDIGFSPTVRGSAVAHVEPQGEFKQQQVDVWNEWGRRDPDVVVCAEGVPLSTVTFAQRPASRALGSSARSSRPAPAPIPPPLTPSSPGPFSVPPAPLPAPPTP